MPTDHVSRSRAKNRVDETQITFGPEVRKALSNIAATAHFSEHFDKGILSVVQDWAAGKKVTVHDFIFSFPTVADVTFKYIEKTGDKRAREAWDTIVSQIQEPEGFKLQNRSASSPRSGER